MMSFHFVLHYVIVKFHVLVSIVFAHTVLSKRLGSAGFDVFTDTVLDLYQTNGNGLFLCCREELMSSCTRSGRFKTGLKEEI